MFLHPFGTLHVQCAVMATRPVLYPGSYAGFIALALLDVLLTWLVLSAGGVELNAIAAWLISRHNVPGMVALKFGTVMIVLIACEIVGSRAHHKGRKLAVWAVLINAVPVLAAAFQLAPLYVS